MKPQPRFLLAHATALAVASIAPAASAGAQDIPEMSPEATAAFAEGMAHYTATEYREASAAFARAYALDPSFAVAAFFEGVNWVNAGEPDSARAAYARATAGRDRMSAYYRHRLDAHLASLGGDRKAYLEANREAARIAPGSKAEYNVAQGTVGFLRSGEALRSLANLDPRRAPMKGWLGYWTVRHRAQHLAGDYEAELASAREARQLFPDQPAVYYDEAEALIALGRIDELPAVVEAFGSLEAAFPPFLVTMAAEAEAHGEPGAARDLLDRAMQEFAALPAEAAAGNTARNWKGIAHHARGEFEEAARIYRELSRENPGNDWYRASAGVMAAERGDRAAADTEIRRLLDKETAADAGDLSMYAANIAAALGDAERFAVLSARARAAGYAYGDWDHRYYAYRKIRGHPAYRAFISPSG
ncbi:MAG TPA: hypothetical protein VMM12_15760 [Longimicrobiales bacterium]|nr:hypothetical protein [Longimicrobiales bacterium]